MGETLNVMTLGGLALAVGILVDEATVTIENINWHLEQGKEVEAAIMDGAEQIVVPAFVSLLSICIVFVPMFFLEGIGRFLFVPMAEAVMAAMVWSFILSRTLVPTMASYLLRKHAAHGGSPGHESAPASRNPLVRFQRAFEAGFERTRVGLLRVARARAASPGPVRPGLLRLRDRLVRAGAVRGTRLLSVRGRGTDPHACAHARSARAWKTVHASSRRSKRRSARSFHPTRSRHWSTISGCPVSGINMTYNNTGTIGSQDGDIQIKLKEDHRPTVQHILALRDELPGRFPGVTFSFLPADIVSQILNFGAPAPIDLQIRGPNLAANFAYAQKLLHRLRHIPGLADARIQQSHASPGFNVDVDRTRAQYVGLTERDVTNSLVVNLAGSSQVAPTFWLNPENGVSYPIVMQTPQYQVDSLAALREPADHRGRIGAAANPRRRSRISAARPTTPSSPSTTSRAWSRSTPRRRDAISVRSPPTSPRWWTRPPRSCRRAPGSRCSAR